ncbi:MAG: cell division protein FtsW [Clostridia bacterium]|nr:cell division protein FtsW [Clostridia bacterium]
MPFFVLTMLVLAVGLVSLFSASFAYAYYWNDGDSYYYIKRQLIFAAIGIIGMLAASTLNYKQLQKKWVVYLALGIALVLLLWVRFVAPPVRNVYRWIRIAGFSIQPSELAKFALILFMAYWISLQGDKMKKPKEGFFIPIGVTGIIAVLVVIEPHLSGTMLIVAIGMVMMFIGGTKLRWLFGTLLLGAGGVVGMVFGLGYERDRIDVWLDPLKVYTSGGEGRDLAWQTVQSLYAIGSGGLMGEGLGNSRQKHLFLPEPQNDFIFSIVCEEMGFVGAVLIIVLFALLVWRGFVIGLKAPDRFSSLLAIGLTAQIGLQVALNLAVVSNAMPNTGISLPFFSYGGSSLIVLLVQMGIILAISRSIADESRTSRRP